MTTERYGDWHIEYNPPPIPTRNCDWQFWHDDYDGAPDAFDNRCGSAASLDDAKMEIDFIEDMDRDTTPSDEAFAESALNRFWQIAATYDDIARTALVDSFAATMQWSDETPQETRDLVVMNLRGFLAWLNERRPTERAA